MQASLGNSAKGEGDNPDVHFADTVKGSDWGCDQEVARRVRAFDPFPVACARRGETTLKIWRAHAVDGTAAQVPGTVLAAGPDGLKVACGGGALLVTELQRPGSRRLGVAEFLSGMPIATGEVLAGAPPEAVTRA